MITPGKTYIHYDLKIYIPIAAGKHTYKKPEEDNENSNKLLNDHLRAIEAAKKLDIKWLFCPHFMDHKIF